MRSSALEAEQMRKTVQVRAWVEAEKAREVLVRRKLDMN